MFFSRKDIVVTVSKRKMKLTFAQFGELMVDLSQSGVEGDYELISGHSEALKKKIDLRENGFALASLSYNLALHLFCLVSLHGLMRTHAMTEITVGINRAILELRTDGGFGKPIWKSDAIQVFWSFINKYLRLIEKHVLEEEPDQDVIDAGGVGACLVEDLCRYYEIGDYELGYERMIIARVLDEQIIEQVRFYLDEASVSEL